MNVLLLFAAVALIHGNYATLLIKGPTGPILEGESITLECLYTDSELNISQVQIEKTYRQSRRFWYSTWDRYWCFSRGSVQQTEKSLVLTIPYAGAYHDGLYRCVSCAKNVTAPDNSSEVLALKVHYLREPYLLREGFTNYLGVSQDLKVRFGDDVVLKCSTSSSEEPSYFWTKNGSDWILPSSTLTLKKVSDMDAGQYTCMAKHPSLEMLSKKRTINVKVLSEDAPWYETSNGQVWVMTIAAAVCLLVFLLSVSIFVCRRVKKARTNKGPIDDRSQKKPIYKSSVDSLPSTCGDKQPLV